MLKNYRKDFQWIYSGYKMDIQQA